MKKSKNLGSVLKTHDRAEVLTFGVGHGDCLLIEFFSRGSICFRLLYDGGVRLPGALLVHLKGNRRAASESDIDLVVLSHVDNDHQGGLHELLSDEAISVGELWLPCLPAFERLSWLFDKRVASAIARASLLELQAAEREIDVIYPMEGHVARFAPGAAVTVAVLSPAPKLLERLYSGSDNEVEELLIHSPTPLEWLVRGDVRSISESEGFNFRTPSVRFDGTSAMTRSLMPTAITLSSLSSSQLIDKLVANNGSSQGAAEPDFFGNSVLNDTSLVLSIDIVIDGVHRRRVVLAGDQQNWSYICSQHPMGLGPDVLKVPHHGGLVSLTDASRLRAGELSSSGIGQFFMWMRPRIAIVSARGMHGLPRTEFREAARAIGTTLVCPNQRSRELIFSNNMQGDEGSCYELFSCNATPQHEFLRLTLSADLEDLSHAACLQGNCHRGAAPIVVMQQRLIEPDESFVRWSSAEVRKQAHWLEQFLRDERAAFLHNTGRSLRARIDSKSVSWARISAEAKSRGLLQFVAGPDAVLRYAVAHGLVWGEHIRQQNSGALVAALTESEYKKLLALLFRFKGFIFVIEKIDVRLLERHDWFELIMSAKLSPFMHMCAAMVGIPKEIFERELGSRLIRDMLLNYSGKIVSLKNPLSEGIQNKEAVFLFVSSKSYAVCRFFDVDWVARLGTAGSWSDEQLDFIMLDPKSIVLPPFFYCDFQYAIELDRVPLKLFYSGVSSDHGFPVRSLDSDQLMQRFMDAKWRSLWSK